MFCPKCGNEIKDGIQFCPKCGANLEFFPQLLDKDETQKQEQYPQNREDEEKQGRQDTEICFENTERHPEEGCEVTVPVDEKDINATGEKAEEKRSFGKWLVIGAVGLILVLFAIWCVSDPKTAHEKLPFLPFIPHQWTEASCTEAKYCPICGKVEGEALGHSWVEATCTEPKTCSACGEIEGEALGHSWIEATCTEPKTCSVCGETEGVPADHKWVKATCLERKHCSVCGLETGELGTHDWIAATTEAPKTCATCGEQEGEPLPKTEWLVDLDIGGKNGKFYLHSSTRPSFNYNDDYHDIATNGYVSSAKDSSGNTYTNGFHMDGPRSDPYAVEYWIDGEFTRFTGTVAPADTCIGSRGADGYEKYVEILCDGRVVFKSRSMSMYSSPEKFSIDVTGVNKITIRYATTDGVNALATVFDAKLM